MGKLITYDPSQYDVPVGVHIARFTTLRDKEPFAEPKFAKAGQTPEPRYGWQFTVIGPPGNPSIGKIIEQDTGTYPSARSGLVRLLNMLLAASGGLQPGQSVDPDVFLGKTYQISWQQNPKSEKGNPWISALMEVNAATATAPAAMAAPPPTTPSTAAAPVQAPASPPPRPPGKKPAPIGQNQRRYWFIDPNDADTAEPLIMRHGDLQAWINEKMLNAADVQVCVEGSQTWTSADAFGFTDAVQQGRPDPPF